MYFALIANTQYGFPPDWTGSAGISMVIALVLFLLPFAKEFSLTGVFSFKAKVSEVKREVSDFKTEIREQIRIQNSNISNVSNNVSVHLPGLSETYRAEASIRQKNPNSSVFDEQKNEQLYRRFELLEQTELAFEMAKLRIQLEKRLRELLALHTNLKPKSDRRFLSLHKMWRMYVDSRPDAEYLERAFRVVLDVGNAGAHGQTVSLDVAVEAYLLAQEIFEHFDRK